jgi:hypothetical protein
LSKCDKLISLPRKIGNLRQLTYLDLYGCNSLQSLPKEIGKLTQLTNLNLNHCWSLISLPKEIGKLTQLTNLNLNHCCNLISLPKAIGKLTQLTDLNLSSCNNIMQLPKSIGYLQNLQYLSLFKCYNLKYLPSTIGDLKALQCLWVEQSNKFDDQAFHYICQLTTLTKLHIDGEENCNIVELCDHLSKLVNLKSFHIYRFYKLETLPDVIESMVCLEEFSVFSCTQIKILPSCIPLFSKLKVLVLDSLNCLESLPALNTLKLLSTLEIRQCKLIKKLPDSFTSSDAFPSLKKLDCSCSRLVEFPEAEDGAMPKLQILNLSYTYITNLPDTLIYLKNLKVVYIRHDFCKKFENTWLSGKFIS